MVDCCQRARLRINLYRQGMLLDNDVMGDGQTEAGAPSGGFRCEEGIEHLFPDLGRNARPVVAKS